ncbi:hypothetical protein NHQ30_007920 [Ciborinia camelliae]|nr:hypothetical protein NHQ30_007920 [Ciborinia camelliae]
MLDILTLPEWRSANPVYPFQGLSRDLEPRQARTASGCLTNMAQLPIWDVVPDAMAKPGHEFPDGKKEP